MPALKFEPKILTSASSFTLPPVANTVSKVVVPMLPRIAALAANPVVGVTIGLSLLAFTAYDHFKDVEFTSSDVGIGDDNHATIPTTKKIEMTDAFKNSVKEKTGAINNYTINYYENSSEHSFVPVSNMGTHKNHPDYTPPPVGDTTLLYQMKLSNLLAIEHNDLLRAKIVQMELANTYKEAELCTIVDNATSIVSALTNIALELSLSRQLNEKLGVSTSLQANKHFSSLGNFFDFLASGEYTNKDGNKTTFKDSQGNTASPYVVGLGTENLKLQEQTKQAQSLQQIATNGNAIATNLSSLAEIQENNISVQALGNIIKAKQAKAQEDSLVEDKKVGEYYNFKNTASVTDTVGQTHKVREVEAKATAEAHLKNRELNEMDFSGLENIPKDLTDIASLVLSDFKNVDGSLKFFDKPHKLVNADFSENPNEVV